MDTMPEQIASEFNKMLKWSKKIQTVPKEQDNDTPREEHPVNREQHKPFKAACARPDATLEEIESDFKKSDD